MPLRASTAGRPRLWHLLSPWPPVYTSPGKSHFVAVGESRLWQARVAVLLRSSLVRTRLGDGFTALHIAAIQGDLSMIACLVRHGADIDARAEQWTCVLSVLVAHGGDVNAVNDAVRTPLHEAVRGGGSGVARGPVKGGCVPSGERCESPGEGSRWQHTAHVGARNRAGHLGPDGSRWLAE